MSFAYKELVFAQSEGEYREKASKFLGYAYHFTDENDLKAILKALKSLHPKAAHCCFAYRIGTENNRFRSYDDGEPGGTAGKPILNAIDSHRLSNVLICVVRYFGGTKLGVAGLITSYKAAADAAIEANQIVSKERQFRLKIKMPYDKQKNLELFLNEYEAQTVKQEFTENCVLYMEIPLRLKPKFIENLEQLHLPDVIFELYD